MSDYRTRLDRPASIVDQHRVIPCGSGLTFAAARTLEEVIAAWGLVYEAYLSGRRHLIDPNPQRIHTVPQAVGPQATVIGGRLDGRIVSTMTVIQDQEKGLPLDSVYKAELDALRSSGRHLVEFGLFGDRKGAIEHPIQANFELICHAFFTALHLGATDLVFGVNPCHAPYYFKCFAVDQFAPETLYPTVRNHTVVPLLLNIQEGLHMEYPPGGLAYFQAHPLPAEILEDRYAFELDAVSSSAIGEYLRFRAAKASKETPLRPGSFRLRAS